MIEDSPFGRIVVARDAPLFYTTRDFDGRLSDGVAHEITRFIRERFGIDAGLVTCHQIHSANVTEVPAHAGWLECDQCDALTSTTPGTALGIKVADCLPVSILAPGAIANIHSGWRGAAQNITARTLDRLKLTKGSDPFVNLRAYLGPSIRGCCFEVGEEVASQFPEPFVDRTRAKPHIDLIAYTTKVLQERGLAPGNIHDSGLCTRCEGSIFHSYRRDRSGGGRNLAIVAH